MKFHHKLSILAGLLTIPLSADTIVLKTGKKYEGTVISEDATSYLVQIQVTKTIKDERKFLKDNVAEIIKESAAEKDYAKLGSLTPTPDQLSTEAYQQRIKQAQAFIAKHAQSPEAAKVKAAVNILERELAVISKGGTKLNGQLISASDLETNAYDIHALIISNEIAKLAKQGLNQRALRKWEELKSGYPNSTAYVDSAPLVRDILQRYEKQLDQDLSTLDARMDKRDSVIKGLSNNDRSRAEQSIAQKKAAYETLIEKEEKELKTRWLTIDPFHKRALEYNQRNTKSELQNISRADSSKVKLAGPSYRGAWAALADGKLDEAAKLLTELKSLRLPEKYTSPLTNLLAEKKAAAEKAAAEKAEQERLAAEAAKKAAEEAKKAAAEEKKKKVRKRKK